VACSAISNAPIIVPAAIATSAHQNASPIEMTTAPRTTLNTFTLPPHQNTSWCHGFPCRAPAGIMSM